MRLPHAAAALAALALALPMAAPAGAAPLGSIFACQASGSKQEGGAVIGALVGGLLGNRIAKDNRGLGTVLGATVGAAAGAYVGCRMQVSDQAKAEAATRQALNAGRNASWANAETGASGDVRLVSSNGGPPPSLNGLRLAPGVDIAASYDGAGGRYQARNTANLRGGPSTAAPVIGRLGAGEPFDAVARVHGSPWLLAGRDGVGIGYVAESAVYPLAAAPAGGPVCRTFDQTIRTQGAEPETQRYTACQGPGGEWTVQSV